MMHGFALDYYVPLVVACVGVMTAINAAVTLHLKQPWQYTAILIGLGALAIALQVVFSNRVGMMYTVIAQMLVVARMFTIYRTGKPATIGALFSWLY